MQILLYPHKFMIDIIYDINNNILNKKYNNNSFSSSFMDISKLILQKYVAYNDVNIDELAYLYIEIKRF